MKMTWEWIAGFFEGEGHIQWAEGKPGGGWQGRGCRLIIGQLDKRPLEAIADFLTELGFQRHRLYQRKPGYRSPNPIWVLALSWRTETAQFLKNIIPMLFQKREKAEYVLQLLQPENWKYNFEPVNVEEALRLRGTGMSWSEVARTLRVGSHKVYKAMKTAGISTGRLK